MKRFISLMSILIVTTVLSGCGDGNANTPSGDPDSSMTLFNGSWGLSGATKAPPESDGEDDACGYGLGDGRLQIRGTQVEGALTDDSGYAYELTGKIDETGAMQGELFYEGYDAATFQGQLTDAQGGGVFQDINGCPGTWEVKRQEALPDRVDEENKPKTEPIS